MNSRQTFKNKVTLTFLDDDCVKELWAVDFYLPSVEEAGMLSYMIRRCLTHSCFVISQSRWTPVGFVPVDSKPPLILHNVKGDFVELQQLRSERFPFRIRLNVSNDEGTKCPFELMFHFSSAGSSDIMHTLLMKGMTSLKKQLIYEVKNRETHAWEERPPSIFVARDLATPFIQLNETSKSKAIKLLQELVAAEEK